MVEGPVHPAPLAGDVEATEPGGRLGPLDRARMRHERLIALLAVGASVVGALTVGVRIATVEAWGGWRILAIALGAAVVFGARLLPFWNPVTWWKPWTRTTFEVSSASAIILVDALVGPEFLVTSSTGYLHVLAVTVCSLRLLPTLSLYAAALGMIQHAAIYAWSLSQLPAGNIPVARHYQELVFRLSVIGIVGGVGFLLARTLAREIAQAANEERVRSVFGSYVDWRVVRRVLSGDLRLQAERRPITAMFVDIRGFTALSATSEPIQLFRQLNVALDAFATEVAAQGGIVNKFTGDGLLALFGAPETQADHARRAVRAALRIVAAAEGMAADGRFPGLRVGVGVQTGEAIVGDVGGARREYTAIGDVVNVAARVESLTKQLDSPVLITDDVRRALGPGAELRAHPPVELRGRAGLVTLYAVESMEGTAPMGQRPRQA